MEVQEKDKNQGKTAASEEAITPAGPHKQPVGKFGHRAYNVLNHLGLNWVGNSSLSLFITYNALPTETAQRFMDKLQKVFTPVSTGVDKVKGMFGLKTMRIKAEEDIAKKGIQVTGEALEKMVQKSQAARLMEHARSWGELCCMLIAGTIVLVPMKIMDDNKDHVVNFFNRIRHGKDHPKEVEPTREDRLSWSRLIKARVAAVATVLGINSLMDNFNVARAGKNKGNFDTAEWKLGSKIYDHMPEKPRSWFINFFNRKGVQIDSIQPGVQGQVMKAINHSAPELTNGAQRLSELYALQKERMAEHNRTNPVKEYKLESFLHDAERVERDAIRENIVRNPELRKGAERAIFAEQARLLSKEVSLTLVVAGVMWMLSKGKKKKTKEEQRPTPASPKSTPNIAEQSEEKPAQFTEKVSPSKRPEKQAESYAGRVAAEVPEASLQPGV